jgi:hypothetical protein
MPFTVSELALQARKLPQNGMPEFTPASNAGPMPDPRGLSPQARAMLAAWKPLLESADLGNRIVGPKSVRDRFATTYSLVMAQMLTNAAKTPASVWAKEATTAATDVPSFARQNLGIILRAYPQMFAMQLFPVTPFSGPGRPRLLPG